MKVEQSGDLGLTSADLPGDLDLRSSLCRSTPDRVDQLSPRIGNDLVGSLRYGAEIRHAVNYSNYYRRLGGTGYTGEVTPGVRTPTSQPVTCSSSLDMLNTRRRARPLVSASPMTSRLSGRRIGGQG